LAFSVTELIPATAVIATRNRCESLRRTLESLANQSAQPAELIIVDASDTDATEELCRLPQGLAGKITYERATVIGAAAQRNQALEKATQPLIWFVDDDVRFEPDCIARLYAAFQRDPGLGGANAMITNQQYHPPGKVRRALYAVLGGGRRPTYAGRCFGPALNLLPEDRDDLPEVVPVEWLNTTCTMYRREALPNPPFDRFFHGYSLGEDTALSLKVGKSWKLANVRTARIYHDTQSSDFKRDEAAMAEMELVNRHYIMTEVLGRRGVADYCRLALLQAYHLLATAASSSSRRHLPAFVWGKIRGAMKVARHALFGIPLAL
jgi:GT2 family glycosyltransferase